jgi:hypothetical protein
VSKLHIVPWSGVPTLSDLDRLERGFEDSIDADELANFTSSINAARARLIARVRQMSDDSCARALGVLGDSRVVNSMLVDRISRINWRFGGQLNAPRIERLPTGQVVGTPYEAAFPSREAGQSIDYSTAFIVFNRWINWSSPTQSFAFDQTGAWGGYSILGGWNEQLQTSMSEAQYLEFVWAHEIAHSFGLTHPEGNEAFNLRIWRSCF